MGCEVVEDSTERKRCDIAKAALGSPPTPVTAPHILQGLGHT